MEKYIFLDNWVYSNLSDEVFNAQLSKYILENNYTVLVSSVLLVEMYNPGWEEHKESDRGFHATKFMCRVPCVVVDPFKVRDSEADNLIRKLHKLPIELDLRSLEKDHLQSSLLNFLRRDESFLSQGKDIAEWAKKYKEVKESWLSDVSNIIDDACSDGNLEKNNKGKLINLSSYRDLFLYSLDLRFTEENKRDSVQQDHRLNGMPRKLSYIRVTSLAFWYLYVDIDRSNRIKTGGSDIGDIAHLGLLPYCSVFTLDQAMFKMLRILKKDGNSLKARAITKPDLTSMLSK